MNNSMSYKLREASVEDAGHLARLVGVLGYEMTPEQMATRMDACQSDDSKVFVALNEGAVIGFLAFHAIPLFHQPAMLGRITAMAIDPDFQRCGIGKLLLDAAEGLARNAGCSRMEVTSGDRREKDAHLFYLSQGYQTDCLRFLKSL